MIDFMNLAYAQVRDMSPITAEKCLLETLAQRATVTSGGSILRWSEYNENPDPLINRMLAKLLIHKMNSDWFADLKWNEVVVISIENSAAYLAVEISFEVMRSFALDRPLRIVRARKISNDQKISPAMNSNQVVARVTPITADGESRYLVASLPENHNLDSIKVVIVVDDFRATGSTLRGGVELAQKLFSPMRIIPVAAMGKPWQETDGEIQDPTSGVELPLTALDVHYWWDKVTNRAMIEANGLDPLPMNHVMQTDFLTKKDD
jgi:adenine/guanine phosphoribosyltransferase-like PRPP-binding protein